MGKKKDERREIPIKFAKDEKDTEGEKTEALAEEPEAAERIVEEPSAPATPEIELNASSERDRGASIAGSELQVQIDTLTSEKSALYDQLLRRQAEFENYRKRVERERSEVFQRARADVLLEMIPVLDNLERALGSLESSDGDAEALRHGVELIHKQFKDALAKLGLQPVESVGCAFDPHVHEAITIEETSEHQENTVIEEFERGYKMGDRLLRPAKVKVASSPDR
jgi:molecular chaperone GrpE